MPEDPGETLARGKALEALCAPVPRMAGMMKGVRGYMVGRAGSHKAREPPALGERRGLRVRT